MDKTADSSLPSRGNRKSSRSWQRPVMWVASSVAGSLIFLASSRAAERQATALAALEQKLCARWQGGACVGSLEFLANGTCQREHFSPGGHKLAGTWEVRWEELPPTLLMTCKTSSDSGYVGKTETFKLVKLNDAELCLELSVVTNSIRFDFRRAKD